MPGHAPLIIDVAGTGLTAKDRKRLRHPLVGGVVLFGRNWLDREHLLQLCQDIKKTRNDLLIAVDHEGGRVQRFKTGGFTHLPAMRVLGELWLGEAGADPQACAMRATRAATACGLVMGSELRSCGVDLSFAPVLDLDYGASSAIGDRAFARDASVVSLLAKSLMHGMLQAGIANCGKHFPGHGFAAADSHTNVALDRRSLEAIIARDASPYAWLGSALDAVMPAHVIYPSVDSRPAGFSQRWLGDILRRRLGFVGAIFSDDLSMTAARRIDGEIVSYSQAAVAALNAGCDLVLLCNQSHAGSMVLDELLQAMEVAQARGEWRAQGASEQRRLALLAGIRGPEWATLMADPLYRRAIERLPR